MTAQPVKAASAPSAAGDFTPVSDAEVQSLAESFIAAANSHGYSGTTIQKAHAVLRDPDTLPVNRDLYERAIARYKEMKAAAAPTVPPTKAPTTRASLEAKFPIGSKVVYNVFGGGERIGTVQEIKAYPPGAPFPFMLKVKTPKAKGGWELINAETAQAAPEPEAPVANQLREYLDHIKDPRERQFAENYAGHMANPVGRPPSDAGLPASVVDRISRAIETITGMNRPAPEKKPVTPQIVPAAAPASDISVSPYVRSLRDKQARGEKLTAKEQAAVNDQRVIELQAAIKAKQEEKTPAAQIGDRVTFDAQGNDKGRIGVGEVTAVLKDGRLEVRLDPYATKTRTAGMTIVHPDHVRTVEAKTAPGASTPQTPEAPATPVSQEKPAAPATTPTRLPVPEGLAWSDWQGLDDLKKEHGTPAAYYDAARFRQQRDKAYLDKHLDRLHAISGKKGANQLRRDEDAQYHTRQAVYDHQYVEVEHALGVRASAQMQSEVEGRPAPADKTIPDKAGFHNFWHGLNRGDAIETPNGRLHIIKVDAWNMQPIIPGGPRGQWGAIGPSHHEVGSITAKRDGLDPKKFNKSELEALLYPKAEEDKLALHAFKEGDKVSWTGRDGQKLTGSIDSDWEDGTYQVKEDRVLHAGGVPIMGSSRINAERLTMVEAEKPADPLASKILFNDSQRIDDLVGAATRALKGTPHNAPIVFEDLKRALIPAREHLAKLTDAGKSQQDLLRKSIDDAEKLIQAQVTEDPGASGVSAVSQVGGQTTYKAGDRVQVDRGDGSKVLGTITHAGQKPGSAYQVQIDGGGSRAVYERSLSQVPEAPGASTTPEAETPGDTGFSDEDDFELDPEVLAHAKDVVSGKLKQEAPAAPRQKGSFKVAMPDGTSNGQRWATEQEAQNAGNELFSRWFDMPSGWKVVPSDDPVTWRGTAENHRGEMIPEKPASVEAPKAEAPLTAVERSILDNLDINKQTGLSALGLYVKHDVPGFQQADLEPAIAKLAERGLVSSGVNVDNGDIGVVRERAGTEALKAHRQAERQEGTTYAPKPPAPTKEEQLSASAKAARDRIKKLQGDKPQFERDPNAPADAGGIGIMELVARNLKAQGKYLSRFISYKGVVFDETTHEITPEQHAMLDRAGDAWRMVIDRFNQAAEETTGNAQGPSAADASRRVRSNAMSQLWGAELSFYRSLYTAMKVPSLIRIIDEALEPSAEHPEGKSVVISVLQTGQAQQDREIERLAKSENADLEDADISPMASLIDMVDKRFPTIEYETVLDEHGNEVTRVKMGADGKPVQNRATLDAKKALLDDLNKLRGEFPDSALDQIINKYGSDKVAEMTKRSERLVRNPETGQRELQSRGSDLTKTNLHEMAAFQNGDKTIAIISNAASTGISLHSSIRAKNQRQRVHVMLQLKWSADMTMQDLGRTHRTAQRVPPHYILLSLNVDAEKRFAATIARRLEQLGALSRGERKAGGGAADFSKYNFESRYGRFAVDQLIDTLYFGNDRFGFLTEDRMKQFPALADGRAVLQLMGLYDPDKEQDKADETSPDVPVNRFFNRLMILPINTANQVFRAFSETMDHGIESAKRMGIFDAGAELIKATHLTQDGAPLVVYQDPITKAQAVFYRLKAQNPRYRFSWKGMQESMEGGFFQNRKTLLRVKATGRLLAVRKDGNKRTEEKTGKQVTWYDATAASGSGAQINEEDLNLASSTDPEERKQSKYELVGRGPETQAEWNKQYDEAGAAEIEPLQPQKPALSGRPGTRPSSPNDLSVALDFRHVVAERRDGRDQQRRRVLRANEVARIRRGRRDSGERSR
jgi:hypothetical protein